MRALVFISAVASLWGWTLSAQEKAMEPANREASPAGVDVSMSSEKELALMRERLERGSASYIDVLEAESRLLLEKIASGDDKEGEKMKRLQEVYGELISMFQRINNKESELEYQIKLLKLSTTPGNREALLDCYKKVIDYKQKQFRRGTCSYDQVLLAEIAYLRASQADTPPEKKIIIDSEILKKQEALEEMYKACSSSGK